MSNVLLLMSLAARLALPPYAVIVATPRISMVIPDRSAVLCGPTADGCTHITGSSFSAECLRDGDAWRLRAGRVFLHEIEHIDDVRRGADGYVRTLRAIRFESLEQCRERAALERARINDVLRAFAQQSFERIR